MAEEYIIGNDAQFNENVDVLGKLNLFDSINQAEKFVLNLDSKEKLRITSDGVTFTDEVERFRITSTGVVSINQNNPTSGAKLEVESEQLGGTAGNTQEVVRLHSPDVSNNTSYRFTNYRHTNGTSHTSSELRFRRHVDATDMGYFGLGDGYASIGYGTAEKLRITSDGDVGIGTNSPVERVHIHKSSATGPFLYITNTSTGVSASDGIQIGYDGSNTAVLKNNENTDLVFYTNGTETLTIGSNKISTFNGDIHLGGQNTATNQNRAIYWTGFDKESVGDVTDNAMIRHTTNVHGITGSVLEIKAENDASDGIALNASSGNGQIALVGKKIDVSGYIEPSYGAGDNGIKWASDPSGGSGDIAHIQYYQNGSGENTRLRILIANDADDDLRFEAGEIRAQGSFSKLSGSFRIPHVLTGLTTTTDLIHSFVEGPQADNLYRGRTTLVAGISTVNIDTINNMTEGTFVNLNRDVQCFTTNETGWTAVKGSVTDNLLTINAQDNTCTDTISWMVIGERWDLAMYDPKNPMTDANGKVKTEIPNNSYNKGGSFEQDYINENKFRVGISTISRPAIENKEV